VADFIPVTQLVASTLVLLASPRLPVASTHELIALAKSEPGRLNYGSSGVGNPLHLTMEMIKAAAGIEIEPVPYRSDTQINAALMTGEIEVAVVALARAINQVKRQLNVPETLLTTFQGNAQAFQDSLETQPLLILAALVAVYIILGMLYESLVHPITILSTRVGALLMLMTFGYELSVVALIGIILLIGIVKKNAIFVSPRSMSGRTLSESPNAGPVPSSKTWSSIR
jgi:hypothetical protein